MVKELKPIDISAVPELLRIAEEVRSTQEPRLLRRDSEDLAILSPVVPKPSRSRKRGKTVADYEAFRSAAGGQNDVDTDALIAEVYADRSASNRPFVELDVPRR